MPLFDWIHSNLHDLNLDWIINKIENVETAEANSAASAADANAAKVAAAGSATAANNSKTAAAGSATAAAASAQTAQNLVDQLDTTIAADVETWLNTHVTPTSPIVDDTLTIQGAAADAKKTGDKITDLKTAFETFTDGEYELVKGWYAVGSLIRGVLHPELNFRVSETEIVSYDKEVTLLVASGFRIGVHIFVNGTCSSESGWKTGEYTIPQNTAFKFIIAKVTEDKSVVANIEEFMSAVTIKSTIGNHTETLNAISEIDLTNLSPKAEAVTDANGYINASTGYFGTVESGKTYTFSAYNNSDKTYGVTIRIDDGGWKQQGIFNPTPNSRFSYTFTANTNGDISLSCAYGSFYDPLFSEIQLQEGTIATEYIPYHAPTAIDKVVRNSIGNALDTVKETLNAISEIDLTNLSPKAEAVTDANGYINASTGYFGTVESGKTYTFSAYNNSDKTYGVTIRIDDGGWKQQGIFNPTPNSRFSYTFTANTNGDISLSCAYGSFYDPLFSEIQLQEGTIATEYIPYHAPTAIDKVVRNSIGNALDTVKEILLKSGIESIAHQGGNIYGYPQNTIPNFIECAKNGWRNVEFDVRWTSDNVPVISHDDSRTIYGTSTTISIANTTYYDLQNMQFFADATIKIPSLYDTLDTCKIYGLKPHIELKTDATTSQITTIINYLKRKKLFEDAFITSFQLGALTSVVGIDNNTNVLLNISSSDSIDELIARDSRFTTLLNHAGKTAFAFSHTLLSGISDPKSHLAEFSDKGGYICIYTLDTDALVETYISMCDYITSNALRVENVID